MFEKVTELNDFAPVITFSPVLNLGSTFGDFSPSFALTLSGISAV